MVFFTNRLSLQHEVLSLRHVAQVQKNGSNPLVAGEEELGITNLLSQVQSLPVVLESRIVFGMTLIDLAEHDEGHREVIELVQLPIQFDGCLSRDLAFVLALVGQKNAGNHPGSAIDKFSFVGDVGPDTSNVVYYVDDVILSADQPVDVPAIIAPGRRKMFVDAWSDLQREALREPGCLPTIEYDDFGIGEAVIRK